MSGKRIAVIGVGAVGGVFAAHLSAVHEVVACVRRPFTSYRVESPEMPFEGPATVATSPSELPWDEPADAVFVGLKAQHTSGAAEWFKTLCGPQTIVVVMQNGIEGRERLEPHVDGSTIVPCVVYCGAELLSPGHIRHDRSARLIVADDDAGQRVQALGEGTPLSIEPSADYIRSAWVKLGINSVVNGLTGLTGRPMDVLAEPGIAAIGNQLLLECWTIGKAEGVELDTSGISNMIEQMSKNVGGRTSMQHDREAQRATEHDAIHGAIIRRGDRTGVATPVTQMIHDLIAASNPTTD